MTKEQAEAVEAVEAEIQESFRGSYPAEGDLDGWKRRSGEWQAAWAGAHKRAAENRIDLEQLKSQIQAAVEAEREACAKIVDAPAGPGAYATLADRAAAIRARRFVTG